jgi:hypothetical protein
MLQPAINVVSQQQIYGDCQHSRYASTIGLDEQTRKQAIGTINCYNNKCDYGTLRQQRMTTTMPNQNVASHQEHHYLINCNYGIEVFEFIS